MKMTKSLAAAGLLLGCVAPAATAADAGAAPKAGAHVDTPVSGNLQYTAMQYWCSKGMPNYFVAVRAVKQVEKSITVSQVQLKETHTLGPLTHDKPMFFFSKINQAGKPVTLTVKGNTSGSIFTVTGTLPLTCAGLPAAPPQGGEAPSKPAAGSTAGKGPKVETDLVRSSDADGAWAAGGAALATGIVLVARSSVRRGPRGVR